MTADDKPAFGMLLLATGEVYNRTLSNVVLELYFAALADLTLAEIQEALTVHVREQKFFPTPAEVRAGVAAPAEERAELAWAGLLAMVRHCGSWWDSTRQGPLPWPDDATKRAALELYGGWRRLCESLPAAGPEFLGAAKQFKALYCAYDRRDRRLALTARAAARELPTGDPYGD